MNIQVENNVLKSEEGAWKISEISSVCTVHKTAFQKRPIDVAAVWIILFFLWMLTVGIGQIIFSLIFSVPCIWYIAHKHYSVEITLNNRPKPIPVYSNQYIFESGKKKIEGECARIQNLIESCLEN